MMKILLTGFEAFGTVEENPSQVIVEQMSKSHNLPDHIDLICEVLPVEYEASGVRIRELIDTHEPDAVIMTGVAGSCDKINVEFWARNNRTATIPDNSGVLLENQPINPDEPIEHFLPSTLPVFSIYSKLNARKIPVERSNNAGGYICNNVFYCAVDYLKQTQRDIPAGFIHIPTFEAIARADMVKAYHHILEKIATSSRNDRSETHLYMNPAIENELQKLLDKLPDNPKWCLLIRDDGLVLGNVGTKINHLDKRGLMVSALDALLGRTSNEMSNGDFSYSFIGGEQGILFVFRFMDSYLIAINWEDITSISSMYQVLETVRQITQSLVTLLD